MKQFILLLVFTLALPGILLSDPVKPVVVPHSVDLPVPAFGQQTDNWCWLAVAEMIIHYKKWWATPKQCEIMEIGLGAPSGTCCEDVTGCDRPGSLNEIMRVIAHFSQAKTFATGPLSVKQLYETLKKGRPVVVALSFPGQSTGHVAVIKGIRYIVKWLPEKEKGKGPRQIVVPYISLNDPRNIFTESIPLGSLRPYWRQSIVVE